MKGFSLPNISIPHISIPNIPISKNIDASAIKSDITSAIPDISAITSELNIEATASEMLSDAIGQGVDLPPELKNLIK